ncbi:MULTISPECIES: cupin domain-containing protein [Tessaracoccus]|uniref:hypothetical protein n=1 Tax=Tessaracoccus TaxID=72763 RepID=UPI000AA2E76B|nr:MULTISPECIES: hypothetical protein [Tessaracoccus]VEP41647.1 hypothetical protein TLA_TLA_02770 [Tessaracoccus lapidicaptus]
MRPVVTQTTIRDAKSQGLTELPVQPGTIITALAREFAQDQGIKLVLTTEQASAPPAADRDDRAALRAAVVKQLGHEPDGLDAALDKVLKEH